MNEDTTQAKPDVVPETTQEPTSNETPPKRPKGKRSLPKDATERQTGKPDPYAYTIKDKAFGEFKVLSTANAWWAEMGKVENLLDAYKIDANDDEACFYAGISIEQLRYFKELHSDFSRIKHACGQNLGLVAKEQFAKQVEKGDYALQYLRMKRKDEGYTERTEQTGANGRDLFDGLTNEIKELGESLRSEIPNDNETEKHTDDTSANDTDAGADGAEHEATPASDVLEGPSVPAEAR